MPNKSQPNNHHHPKLDSTIQCVNELDSEKMSKGHLMAEHAVQIIGSWKFIVIQSIVLFFWAMLNILAWFEHWDPYPFILLNLFLSLQAAYAGPVIMMSQNRQAARDRLEAHNDYLLNIKAEQEIRGITQQLEVQNLALKELRQLIVELHKDKSP